MFSDMLLGLFIFILEVCVLNSTASLNGLYERSHGEYQTNAALQSPPIRLFGHS